MEKGKCREVNELLLILIGNIKEIMILKTEYDINSLIFIIIQIIKFDIIRNTI